jgi:hypothetical protein
LELSSTLARRRHGGLQHAGIETLASLTGQRLAEQALLSKGRLPKDVPTFLANEVLTNAKIHTIA